MKRISVLLIVIVFAFISCGEKKQTQKITQKENIKKSNTETKEKEEEIFFKSINYKEFLEVMKIEGLIKIDLRTEQEYATGILPGAKLINVYRRDYQEKLNKLDKDRTYLIYCYSGGRSGSVIRLMKKMGFKKVYNYRGGTSDLIRKGYELVKP